MIGAVYLHGVVISYTDDLHLGFTPPYGMDQSKVLLIDVSTVSNFPRSWTNNCLTKCW